MQKKKNKLLINIAIISLLLLFIASSITIFNNFKQINNDYNPELARAMEYQKVKEGEDRVSNTDYVKFDAFFLQDLDNDGYADKIRGTCKEITQTDTLYMNLNVLTNGKLENGQITIQGQNINLKTAIVEDDVISGNYISENTKQINLKTINKGTQKLIYATVKAQDLGLDTNKYSSKTNQIILTGEHVADNGQRTTIRKAVNFTVDWYASVSCSIYDYSGAQNIDDVIDKQGGNVNLSFYIQTKEDKNLAILNSSYLTGKIPPLNGYMPTKVEITGTDITYTYNQTTGEFVAKRISEINASKIVTKYVPRTNMYRFKVVYPIQAYEELGEDTISTQIPIQAYYEGYNNPNPEFENPIKSNIATKTLNFLWRKPEGEMARFDVTVGKYRSYDNQYVVSKREPLKIYNNIEEQTYNDTYEVKWIAYTGSKYEIYSLQMKEQTGENDEDRFQDTEDTFYDMSEFSKNIGIYFSGADNTLGEGGEIRVYNAEDGHLINTFTKDNWNTYSSSNPYKYETPVKHIRIETSKVNKNSNFTVYNIKEINDSELCQRFTKPNFDKLQNIYSYLTGNIKRTEGAEYETIDTDIGIALYEAPISVATIEIDRDTFGTQKEEENIDIKITTLSSYYNMEGWKNGKFLVKLPSDVLELKVNKITPSTSNIKILAHEVLDIDGQKFIQLETENENPTNYNITINCNITANPKMITKTEIIELYASNENCENYKDRNTR